MTEEEKGKPADKIKFKNKAAAEPREVKIQAAMEFIRNNPMSTMQEVMAMAKCSPRTVKYARLRLMEQGVLTVSRRAVLKEGESRAEKGEIRKKMTWKEKQPLNTRDLLPLAQADALEADAEAPLLDVLSRSDEFDDETRKKMLNEVKGIAFNSASHPDTRLAAINAWAKLRDIAKAKDLGPGLPKTEPEIINRLSRLMEGVGVPLVLKALEKAFPKETFRETKQTSTPIGATETLNPA